ncbi:MAG: ATP-binding protein, partial [Candidatus Binatia bacterium]
TILLGRLERSVLRQHAISASLEENAARLATANTDLQNEVASRRLAQEQTARLARAVEQAGDGILIAHTDGAVVYANTACGRFCSVPASQLIGSNIGILWPPDDPLAQVAEAIAVQGSLAAAITRTDNRNRLQEVGVGVAPLREEAGCSRYHVVVLRDCTHERNLETRLRQSEKLEAVGTLAGGIAHDFNNIIGAILAVAESIRDDDGDAAPRDAVEPIIRACLRARDIVRQMMVFGGRTVRERHPIAVAGIVEETLSLLRAALPAAIRIHCEAETKASVVAEPVEVQQILMNLATNAAHAMELKGGGHLYISVADFIPDRDYVASHPGIEAGTAYIRLTVRDTGDGIDSEHLSRIFEPFFTTKPQGSGTGLGLASVHGIVNALGGTIDVYTEIGQGTAFHVYLPVAEPNTEGVADRTEETPPLIAGSRVLLVDDEESLLRIGEVFLTRAGYQVKVASDGDQARRLLEASPDEFDLVVTDLTMPGLSGADLIRAAHQLRPDLPFILASGFGNTMTSSERAELAPFSFLQKPYSQVELAAAVREMLSART